MGLITYPPSTKGFHSHFQTKSPLMVGGTCSWCHCFLQAPVPKPSPSQTLGIQNPLTEPNSCYEEKHPWQMLRGERKHYRPSQLPFLTGMLVQTMIKWVHYPPPHTLQLANLSAVLSFSSWSAAWTKFTNCPTDFQAKHLFKQDFKLWGQRRDAL